VAAQSAARLKITGSSPFSAGWSLGLPIRGQARSIGVRIHPWMAAGQHECRQAGDTDLDPASVTYPSTIAPKEMFTPVEVSVRALSEDTYEAVPACSIFLEYDPEKCVAVFGKDHAKSKK
jgi:hypothetical protein